MVFFTEADACSLACCARFLMSRLITTLLDLSALENGATQLRPERFDFVDFVETVAGRLLIDTPDADFILEYELPEHPVYVNTDKGRMEQVLNNLIVNAKRNNSPGGILKLSLLEKDGLLDFSILNQGLPILEESLSKIWSKFYRDKNSKYSGSGLGLAIVAQVLSMQHLNYGAENQPGGVAFYFSLPTVKIDEDIALQSRSKKGFRMFYSTISCGTSNLYPLPKTVRIYPAFGIFGVSFLRF